MAAVLPVFLFMRTAIPTILWSISSLGTDLLRDFIQKYTSWNPSKIFFWMKIKDFPQIIFLKNPSGNRVLSLCNHLWDLVSYYFLDLFYYDLYSLKIILNLHKNLCKTSFVYNVSYIIIFKENSLSTSIADSSLGNKNPPQYYWAHCCQFAILVTSTLNFYFFVVPVPCRAIFS